MWPEACRLGKRNRQAGRRGRKEVAEVLKNIHWSEQEHQFLLFSHTVMVIVNQEGSQVAFPRVSSREQQPSFYSPTQGTPFQSFVYKAPFISIKQSCKHNANSITGTLGWLKCFSESLRRIQSLCLICEFTAVEDRGRETVFFNISPVEGKKISQNTSTSSVYF